MVLVFEIRKLRDLSPPEGPQTFAVGEAILALSHEVEQAEAWLVDKKRKAPAKTRARLEIAVTKAKAAIAAARRDGA